VEGNLRSRSWETPDGQKRSAVDIEALRVESLQLGLRKPEEAFVADAAGGQRLRHGLNLAMVVGNLTRDAELRFTPQGSALLRFAVAVNEKYQDKSGAQQERTNYVNVVAWRELAEATGNAGLKLGDPVFVLGRFQSRGWTDSDGQRRRSFEIEADRIELLTRAPVREAAGTPGEGEKVPDFDIDQDQEFPPEEDLPF